MTLRTSCIITLALGILAAPLAADAQQAVRAYRIGVLGNDPWPALEGLRQGLRELGYIEGQNLHFEYRWVEGRSDRFPALAADLVRLKVDAIVTWGTPGTSAAKQATTTIPIIMAATGDPVGAGLISSLARPGGNITGQSSLAAELEAKRLELLKELLPSLSRVGVLFNAANPYTVPAVKHARLAAQVLGLKLDLVDVRTADDLDSALLTLTRLRPDAALVMAEPFLVSRRARITEFMAKSQFPAAYSQREYVETGGLIAYATNYYELFRRAATFVDKILKGAKPADLPVEQPTKFELVINLKTARALGLTIPQSLLIRADKVIE